MTYNIQYDKPIEVNERQYQAAMSAFSGIVAGQEKDGKYFIKCWFIRYKKELNSLLNKYSS